MGHFLEKIGVEKEKGGLSLSKSNNRQQNNQSNRNEEVQPSTTNDQIKEMTDAQRDGIRYDYTDSSDF